MQLVEQCYSIILEQKKANQTTQDAFKLICLYLEVPISLN
jgi:hypothetical protein